MNKKCKQEEKNIRHICDVLIAYYLHKCAQDFRLDIKRGPEEICIFARGSLELSEEELQNLNMLKDPHRIPEYESYYEELLCIGCANNISNLDGLSSIVDEAKWTYENAVLSMELLRKL